MTVAQTKIEIIQWISQLSDKDTLKQLQKLKEDSLSKEAEILNKMSDEEIQTINRGLNDLDNNRIFSHEDVMKKYEKWL